MTVVTGFMDPRVPLDIQNRARHRRDAPRGRHRRAARHRDGDGTAQHPDRPSRRLHADRGAGLCRRARRELAGEVLADLYHEQIQSGT
ncbi:hypothetical protein AB5I41_11325 [Sphingomonas sp. MMS24-JH45]